MPLAPILQDRDVVTCTDLLRRHPEVEVISRDRCGLYAQAARQGSPQAEQVADRDPARISPAVPRGPAIRRLE